MLWRHILSLKYIQSKSPVNMWDFTALENYTSVYWSKLPFTCMLSHLAFLLIYVFLPVFLTFSKYALLN